jgi:hypothetical protein
MGILLPTADNLKPVVRDAHIVCDEKGCRIVAKTEEPIPNYHENSLKKIGKDTWMARITDQWLPIPAEAAKALGWEDGDEIELFPSHGQVILRKKGALQDGGR